MPLNSVQGAGGLYGRLVSTRPQGAAKFRSMRSDLGIFGVDDLYEYACPEGFQNPRLATSESLIARSEQRVSDWMRNTSEYSAAERLCSRAREVFGDDAERRRYDEYLQWCDLKAVFDGLEGRMDPAVSSCTDEDVVSEIACLCELLGSRSQAEALMESYLASRGIELVNGHDLQVSTAQGRAQVRDELAAANLLPDSALEPSTPAPPTQPMAARDNAAPQVREEHEFGSQVGVVRRCTCGYLNSAEQNFCQACGRPLEGTTVMPPIARTSVSPAVQVARRGQAPAVGRRSFPAAAVIVAIVIVLAVGGGSAFFLMGGVSGVLGESGSSASSELSKNTKRIQSGYVTPVECSSKTLIKPLDVDEEPLEIYTVSLNRKQSGVSIDSMLRVGKRGGGPASFSIADFNDPNGKTLEDVPDGMYEVVMTGEDGNVVCKFTADYKASGKGAPETIEVVANK